MSFSKEDRREVYDFFENLLLKADRPIYFEHLRGNVVKASPVVKRYVTKKCKGENLLKYFETRKNYFEVSLKQEVSLKKNRCRLLSYKSEFDETEEANEDEKLNDGENSVSEENFEDLEYPFEWPNSRCYSTASDITADIESIEEYATSRYKLTHNENLRSDYEELTNKYFCRYLSRHGRVEISQIEVENLPKKVKRYIKNYMHNKLLPFFKSNSECYLVEEDKYVSLILSPVIKDTSPKNVEYVEDSPVIVDMIDESFDDSNAEAQTVDNFLSCVEFFVGILKKKSCVPLKNLSGSLSQAPSSILTYLKSNYGNYKNFLLFVPCLFTVNEREEVSLTKECYTLLKRAKKLLRLKSNAEFWSQPIENIICSLFTTEVHPKNRNSSLENEELNSINEQQLEDPVMSSSNEADVCSESNIESYCKISGVYEKLNASEKEVLEFESSDDCGNVIQRVHSEIALDKAAKETPPKLENTTAYLASDLKNWGPNRDTKLSNDTKASMNNQEKVEIQSDAELKMKAVLSVLDTLDYVLDESFSVLNDENIKVPVNPASATFLEKDDNSCILSNDTAMKKQTSRHFIECAFTTQLLCLEIIEREKNLTLSFEYEAVKYFVEILESSASLYSHGKTADVNVLKGKIGQASVGVKLFLKQFYKGEKIVSFFQKYDEFILDSHTSWIKLSPHYEKSLENRRIENENFNKGIKIFHVHSLYNSYFHDVVAEVFDCLFKICTFLHKSTKMKFNRLCGKFLHLSSIQQNFFNSLSGSEIIEKLEKFLLHFDKLFYFNDVYIQIDPELDILFLVYCMNEFNKQLKLSSEFKLPYFHHLSDFIVGKALPLDFEEMKKVTIECVQNFFSYTSCFNYSDLPNIVEHEVLHSLILDGKDSRCLIKLLEDCELFELKDGQIFLKKDNSEQVIDNFTRYDELSNSNLHITDSNDNTLHKESTEQEHINEVQLGLNKNISSQHQNTVIIESNNKSCTDNMGVEDSLEDNNKNSKHFSENSSSFCKTEKVEKSISDPEIDCIDEGNKGDEKAISRLSSPAFLKDSCPMDSNYDSLSCIKKTAYLNDEKSVEGDSLINSITSGLQALVINERENENNSKFNLDKSENEGIMGIKAAENLTNSRVLDLKEVPSEKLNKSPERPAIRVNHAVELNTSENLKSNKLLGANNLEKFSIKGNYVGVPNEGSGAVKNELKLRKTISKFTSEPNSSSEECVDSESQKLCDDVLTLNSVKHSNELLDSDRSCKNLANTIAASNNKTFEVNYEESLNSGKCLDRDTIEISSTCDDKSLKVAKTTHFIPNDEFENNKGNFDDKTVLKSSASDSNVSKNNEDVTKFEEKDEICTDENDSKLGKITQNLNENSPREKLPACSISKNRFLVNLFKNKEEGNSKLSEAAVEDTSRNDKENIEKNKLNINTCLNTENTVNSSGRNKTKSSTKDVHATLKNKAEFKEITNEDSPCLNDLKRKSKNACINEILKSNNVDTEVHIGDCVKDCSKEKLLQADNEAGISKDVIHAFKDGTNINKSPFSSIVPEHSKFDPKVSELACNKTTDNKFLLTKEPRKISNLAFSCVKRLPEESVIESKSDLTTDLKSDASISDSHCHSAQTKVKETRSNVLSSNYKVPEIKELKQNVDENCSSDLSNQNLNLQPLQCKVILLTVDSCIVETVINGCRKYIFCLKSSFFCDEHIDCLCFNNLIVGDSVQCYIPPGTEFSNGNMCIAFMMCHNSNASEVKSDFSPQMPNKELHLDNTKSFFKDVSSTIPNYLSLKQMPVRHKMSECQTDISGEIKRCSSVAVKKCQTKCLTVSKSTQAKYEERKNDSCDKSFQTQVSTALQSTQTIYKSTENECQTIFSGKVKPCFLTDEKACQVQCANNSFGTQTSCKYSDKGSQTCSNTPALTSSKSNTDLSGPVRKCVRLSDKSSQVSSLSSLVCQTTQTVPENANDLKSRLFNLSCDQQLNVNVQNASVCHRSALTAERAYPMCDVACQTASTGPIMIKRYYM